jgi:hypothetical protein
VAMCPRANPSKDQHRGGANANQCRNATRVPSSKGYGSASAKQDDPIVQLEFRGRGLPQVPEPRESSYQAKKRIVSKTRNGPYRRRTAAGFPSPRSVGGNQFVAICMSRLFGEAEGDLDLAVRACETRPWRPAVLVLRLRGTRSITQDAKAWGRRRSAWTSARSSTRKTGWCTIAGKKPRCFGVRPQVAILVYAAVSRDRSTGGSSISQPLKRGRQRRARSR